MDNDFATGYALGADSGSKDVCVVPSNNGGGFGGNGSWGEMIFAIIILAMFCGDGFGGGLFGGRGGNGGGNGMLPYAVAANGALTRADLCQDMNFQSVENGVRGIQQGICDSTFALNNTMTGGFNASQMAMMQGFNGVENAVCTLGYQNQAGFNALGTQLASCCCETKSAIGDVKYQMATDTCAIQNTIQSTTRDIIDNQNANYRGIMDYLCQDKIATLQAENQSLKLAASQANQNNYLTNAIVGQTEQLINRIAPTPVPSYQVPAPYPYCVPQNGYGNGGCGC